MKLRSPSSCIQRGVKVQKPWIILVITCMTILLIIANTKMTNESSPIPSKDLCIATPLHTTSNLHTSRLSRALNFCSRSKPGKVRRIMVDKIKKLANCVIPKAGCTFWINIFRFIKNEMHGKMYKSPFHIPRWITHYGNRSVEYFIRKDKKMPAFLRDAFRFMFVRDPYKRLWASWIDKFLLPDFWFEMGKIISAEQRFGHRATQCPINITFVDFLQFVTSNNFLKYPEDHNEHWAPFHEMCDPCIFHPHFIGKMETFEEDSSFVLAKTNLSWVKELFLPQNENFLTRTIHQGKYSLHDTRFSNMKSTKSRQLTDNSVIQLRMSDQHILHEMVIITNYILNGVWKYYTEIEQCVSKHFVAGRLWLAFQYNGYIPKDCDLILDSKVNSDSFREAFLMAYSKWDKNYTTRRHAQTEQKRHAMQAAYQLVPLHVMKKIQKVYMNDFMQYGYDPEPKVLFQKKP